MACRSTTADRLRARRRLQGDGGAGGGGSGPSPARKGSTDHASKLEDLWTDAASKMSASDVDAAWERLLEETLPPHKREALMTSYEAERDPRMRYNMLLEFSSYLRQGAAYAEGDGKSAGGGGTAGAEDFDDGINLKWEIARVLLIVAAVLGLVMGVAYYLGTLIDNEDSEEL